MDKKDGHLIYIYKIKGENAELVSVKCNKCGTEFLGRTTVPLINDKTLTKCTNCRCKLNRDKDTVEYIPECK